MNINEFKKAFNCTDLDNDEAAEKMEIHFGDTDPMLPSSYVFAVSSTDEFTFKSDGTYSSMYRSANINNGGTQFGGQDFKGTFSVTDWSVTASNRYKGKTTTYKAQLIAVNGGYLLYMEDADNASMNYTLFKAK